MSPDTQTSPKNYQAHAVSILLGCGAALLGLGCWAGPPLTPAFALASVLTSIIAGCFLIRRRYASEGAKQVWLGLAQTVNIMVGVSICIRNKEFAQMLSQMAQWIGLQSLLVGLVFLLLPRQVLAALFPEPKPAAADTLPDQPSTSSLPSQG